MYNNKQYNTRNSGRYNSPGQFVSASEQRAEPARVLVPATQVDSYSLTLAPGAGAAPGTRSAAVSRAPPPPPPPATAYSNPPNPQYQPPRQPAMHSNLQTIQTTEEVKTEQMDVVMDEQSSRPPWMKNRLAGIKKLSNRERRRRQNESLRRLIAPKNALMVLNEMMPNEQVTNQFKVEPAGHHAPGGGGGYFNRPITHHSFCADLTLDGQTYKGYGDNKMAARNAAAEQAIRDLIIKRMNKPPSAEGSQNGEEGGAAGDAGGAGATEEEALPMIQLASFALHKLFAEWECEGHKVPQLKQAMHSTSEAGSEAGGAEAGGTVAMRAPPRPATAGKPKELPLNAAAMHPSMLLSYMRPLLQYRELAVEGDRPQAMTFTLGVDVDGATYIGKASNKKEARRLAARSACQALFGVVFDEVPSAIAPVPKV